MQGSFNGALKPLLLPSIEYYRHPRAQLTSKLWVLYLIYSECTGGYGAGKGASLELRGLAPWDAQFAFSGTHHLRTQQEILLRKHPSTDP